LHHTLLKPAAPWARVPPRMFMFTGIIYTKAAKIAKRSQWRRFLTTDGHGYSLKKARSLAKA
jgi:hypothetical protein